MMQKIYISCLNRLFFSKESGKNSTFTKRKRLLYFFTEKRALQLEGIDS